MISGCAKLKAFTSALERFGEPLVLLGARLWIGYTFFSAGMSKLDNYLNGEWSTTVYIFQDIYPLPGVPAKVVAPLWTGAELVFPALLILGIAGRLSAFGLLVLTFLMEVGMRMADPDHEIMDTNIMGALLLAVIVVRGGGLLSVDNAVCGRKKKDAV